MSLSAEAQYLLELINLGRLDPLAEAKAFGIDLNQGLGTGTISAGAKQVLAPNALLQVAATGHASWMLAHSQLTPLEDNGSDPGARLTGVGYNWTWWGEGIGAADTAANPTLAMQHLDALLFLDTANRQILMNPLASEAGLGIATGTFNWSDGPGPADVISADFAAAGTKHFLTGVAYDDLDHNGFYSIGEGTAGVSLRIAAARAVTEEAGGYALQIPTPVAKTITIFGHVGTVSFDFAMYYQSQNIKLDVISGTTLRIEGGDDVVLGQGINNLTSMTTGALAGNAAANRIVGGAGVNALQGFGGNDWLQGAAGNDVLQGGDGADTLIGGYGRDTLYGEAGNDVLWGGFGPDRFYFLRRDASDNGIDTVRDFSLAQGDMLGIDERMVGPIYAFGTALVAHFARLGTNEVIFDFGSGQEVHLAGLTSLAGLSDHILII